MQENEYYVYVYLDPRKQGYYQYGSTSFEYEPFYVGKGKGARKSQHLFEASLSRGSAGPKVAKIRKLVSLGLEPIVVTPFENLSESVAYAKEDEMITLIGSPFIDNIEDGPLVNMLLGANPPNHKGKSYVEIYGSVERAESEKRKRREKLDAVNFFNKRGTTHTDATKRKMSVASKMGQCNGGYRKGKIHTDETRQLMSESHKKTVGRKKLYKILHVSGNIYYTIRISEFCKEFGLSLSTIKLTYKRQNYAKSGKTAGWMIIEMRHIQANEQEPLLEAPASIPMGLIKSLCH